MRKILITALAALAVSSPVFADGNKTGLLQGGYITLLPKGQIRNFSLVIPADSKVIYADGIDETTYTISVGSGKIRIRALYSKDTDIVQRIREKKWELRDIDPSTRTIIDGDPVTIRSSVKGTLLVYQYRDTKKKGSVIQRTLVTSQSNFVYVIDCYAPIADFYRYEQAFNIAMGGFLITGSDYTPSPKTPQDNASSLDTDRKRPEIKVDQNEINSMGLKEEAKTPAETEQK